jgi:SAM-dependent methyltransferase
MDAVLQEQIGYYRARASEYDEWFLRQGRFDRGPESNRRWLEQAEVVYQALDAFRPAGRMLELAPGTGLWTQRLLRYAQSLTAVDASPEMLALCKARVGAASARFILADIFSWQPDASYDVVFFSFWLSHVPWERFAPFWEKVRSCLAPGGRVFFVDSLPDPTSTAADHVLPEADATTMLRKLNDGREFTVVKVFHQPKDLAERLGRLGWQVTVRATGNYFIFGWGSPSG